MVFMPVYQLGHAGRENWGRGRHIPICNVHFDVAQTQTQIPDPQRVHNVSNKIIDTEKALISLVLKLACVMFILMLLQRKPLTHDP